MGRNFWKTWSVAKILSFMGRFNWKKKKSGIRIHELGHEIWHLDVCSRDVIHRCVSRRLKFRGYITHQADRAKVIFFCLCINELCKVIRPISFLHLFPPYVALILYIAQWTAYNVAVWHSNRRLVAVYLNSPCFGCTLFCCLSVLVFFTLSC